MTDDARRNTKCPVDPCYSMFPLLLFWTILTYIHVCVLPPCIRHFVYVHNMRISYTYCLSQLADSKLIKLSPSFYHVKIWLEIINAVYARSPPASDGINTTELPSSPKWNRLRAGHSSELKQWAVVFFKWWGCWRAFQKLCIEGSKRIFLPKLTQRYLQKLCKLKLTARIRDILMTCRTFGYGKYCRH